MGRVYRLGSDGTNTPGVRRSTVEPPMADPITPSPASSVREVAYRADDGVRPLDVFRLSSLRDRMAWDGPPSYERTDFDLLILPIEGVGTHEVDFETVTIDPMRWLHVRPGQVHRWHPDDYDATLVLLAPRPGAGGGPPGPHLLDVADLSGAEPLRRLLEDDRRADLDRTAARALAMLVVGWLDLDRLAERDVEPLHAGFRRLLDDDEVPHPRRVVDLARRLHCSPRTLARACERAGAPTPKRMIDEHTVLEAQRRLALPGSTVSATAAALGFDELTNFTKFFRRLTGTTPTAWQERSRD